MKIKRFSLGAMLLVSNFCHAQIVLQCDTQNHKQIQLLDLGDTLQYKFGQYKFGKKSHPELIFTIPKNQATFSPWGGVGGSEYYSIELPNHNFTYHLYSSLDRHYYSRTDNSLTKKPEGGVVVMKNNNKTTGDKIASFDCLNNTHYINRIDEVDLPYDELK